MISKEISYGDYQNIPEEIQSDEDKVREFCEKALEKMEQGLLEELKKDHNAFRVIKKEKTIGVVLTVAYEKDHSLMIKKIHEEMNL